MLKHLVERTPVDTTRHISEWQVGVGVEPAAPVGRPFVPGRAGSTKAASAKIVLRKARAVLRQETTGPIYIVNHGPVIEQLEQGTASRQPGGFVLGALVVAGLIAKTLNFNDTRTLRL